MPRGWTEIGAANDRPGVRIELEDGLGACIGLVDLPPLPRRGRAYYFEPIYGVMLVAGLCVSLIQAVCGIASLEALADSWPVAIARELTWCFAVVAAACTAFIVLGHAGEIRRSQATCYPIPDKVREMLLASQSPESLGQNVEHSSGRSYCVRCLVWRPPGQAAHHCRVCNRCVHGFDHHCSTFGRCIVRSNMPCFALLFAMLAAGFLIMIFAFIMYARAPVPSSMTIASWHPAPEA